LSERAAALAHQFDDLGQQHQAASLGMWVFLATEIMFFGGLFAGYAVYRSAYSRAFAESSHHLDIILGGVNTAVLLCSSLTMALAVRSAQLNRRRAIVLFLIATMVLGAVFLGVKFVEYRHKYEERLIPGPGFHLEAPQAQHAQLFFSFYFVMTGMHALHMVIGVPMLGVMGWLAFRGRFSRHYYSPVEMAGLYWHFVDIVWVFLFPMLYLIDRAG